MVTHDEVSVVTQAVSKYGDYTMDAQKDIAQILQIPGDSALKLFNRFYNMTLTSPVADPSGAPSAAKRARALEATHINGLRTRLPTRYVGDVTVFHATNRAAAESISKSKRFKQGSDGKVQAGIYFAETIEEAKHKSIKGSEVVFEANVRMGEAQVVDPASGNGSLHEQAQLIDRQMSTLLILPAKEFVVYDPTKITSFKVQGI